MTDEQRDLDDMKRQLKEWRRRYPNATFLEMERAVEEQVSKMRAAMLQDIANDRGEEIKLCPQCRR
ncbi:MAG TPA: hypothetical protein VF221_19850, partial [Chloroflexota bacterium]